MDVNMNSSDRSLLVPKEEDLPTRLRELAPQLKEIMSMIPAEEDGAIRMLDYMKALEAENLGYKFEEWATELEKEDGE